MRLSNNNKKKNRFAMTVLAITIPLIAACNKDEAKPAAHGPLPVTTTVVKPVSVSRSVELVAQAEGSKEVEVRARVGGILEEQRHQDGQHVNQGDVLYVLDKEPLIIEVERSRANAMEKIARTKQAIREESRLGRLYAGKAISQKEYEASVSEREMAQAAQAGAKTELKLAELNLSYATVKAPISGVVSRAEKSIGSLMTTGSDSLLTKMVQVDPIWVNFSLSGTEYRQLELDKKGPKALTSIEAVLPDGSTYPVKGTINFIDSKVDTSLSTIQMRAEFSNPDGVILPGQFLRVKLASDPYENAFAVPQGAVMQSEAGRFVYTVSQDGHAVPTQIEVGPWNGANWVVTSGLKDGDQVVVDNLIKLRPGAEVAPKTPQKTEEVKP